jgi:hypothetical protein
MLNIATFMMLLTSAYAVAMGIITALSGLL